MEGAVGVSSSHPKRKLLSRIEKKKESSSFWMPRTTMGDIDPFCHLLFSAPSYDPLNLMTFCLISPYFPSARISDFDMETSVCHYFMSSGTFQKLILTTSFVPSVFLLQTRH